MTGRIMVLGGTGFLGSHIREAFQAAGCGVVSVSRNGSAGPGRHVRLDLARAGIADLGSLLADEAPDVVVNAAGLATPATDRQLRAINAEFVARLVAATRDTRLIQIGSSHEYGPDVPGSTTAESHPPAPLSMYGRTKLDGARAALRGRAVVLRVSNVAGPRARADTLPAVVARRLAGIAAAGCGDRPAELRLAPLRTWRDYVDVRDVAQAVLAAVAAPAVTGQVINIASGTAVHVRTVVQRLIALGGLPVRLVEDSNGSLPREPMQWQRLDVSRARELLGWRAEHGLDESLTDLLSSVWPPDRQLSTHVSTQR
ncbi:MAG TPA: NAD(P)-dependent oxidoreductase [Actinophytocola sp.]|uniref:NAD-dependent epimerase/dehydratase family protein n=1 Tax=Actinophytocola sp. TaxID=1872138 RepID=UPI002DB6968F|nr:NAD(P)-dependent oxidoreductase [Actinophytocola sp.]HEU5472961.1 NAD(P)-dependent oxidoreductase [Actinophytocola sp.]